MLPSRTRRGSAPSRCCAIRCVPISTTRTTIAASPSYQSLGLLPALRRAATGPDANEQQTEGMAYGDPARIIRAVKKWESLGVDCINFILNANEVVPQDQVVASLKLFAKEVMPHFAKKPANAAAAE